MPLQLTSPAFSPDGTIPAANTCDGTAGSPALAFSGVPSGAKSLAVIIDDPDVPWVLQRDHLFVHWVRWDLPPGSTGIPEGKASEGLHEDGAPGYVDPCPPNGDHRYVFKLFALDTVFGSEAHIASADDLYRQMSGHTLARAELVGHYARPFVKTAAPFAVLALASVLVAGGIYGVYRGVRGLIRNNEQTG